MDKSIILVVAVLVIYAGFVEPSLSLFNSYDQMHVCPNGRRPSPCFMNPCRNLRCLSDPSMHCVPDYCNECSVYWVSHTRSDGYCKRTSSGQSRTSM